MQALKLTGVQRKSISVDGGIVKISKSKGIVSTEREKIIPISTISGVEVKKPGALARGFIQIQTAGQVSGSSTFTLTGGAYNAASDENSVLFDGKESYAIALEIQKYVLGFNQNGESAPKNTDADEIMKYKRLLDSGAITQDEYDAKKRQILGL